MRRLAGLLACLAVVATACSETSDAGPTSTQPPVPTSTPAATTTTTTNAPVVATKPYGGEVRLTSPAGFPETLNPLLLDSEMVPQLGPLYLTGVWRTDGDTGEPMPLVVTELPTVDNGGLELNPDGTVRVRYRIDPDAVWSDGVPITGDDFAFTYELYTSAGIQGAPAPDDLLVDPPWGVGDVAMPDWDVYQQIIPGSLEVGPKTFAYTVQDIGAHQKGSLFRVIVPGHAVRNSDFVADWNRTMWPSGGPFVFESLDVARHELVLTRNDRYWRNDPDTGQQLPFLDRVVYGMFYDERRDFLDARFHPLFDAEVAADPPGWLSQEEFASIVDALGFSDEDLGEYFEFWGSSTLDLFRDGVVADFRDFIVRDGYPELGAGPSISYTPARSRTWEHLTFHFGPGRLDANDASLVEHVEFRRGVAYAVDRRRIAREVYPVDVEPIGSLIDAYSTSVGGEGWSRFPHDPERAMREFETLCDKIGRDCEADPLTLVFTANLERPDHTAVAEALERDLGAVGVEVVTVSQGLDAIELCRQWEASTWAWESASFSPLTAILDVFDPRSDLDNLYNWGTDAITEYEGREHDGCDVATLRTRGPSAVVDEFTERFAQLMADLDTAIGDEEILDLVLEMEEILAEQAVMIPLYVRPNFNLFRSDQIAGYGFGFYQFDPSVRLWNVDRWYRVDLAQN